MLRTRVKICGITRVDDALAAVDAGADALGFVFYRNSPRAVTPEQAAQIQAALPALVNCVGLFVDADADEVSNVLAHCSLDTLQFHGNESAAFCQRFDRPYMKALRVRPEMDLRAELAQFVSARAVLLDAYKAGVPGGTGECFDWGLVPAGLPLPCVLAGGLNADNVGAAIRGVKPYAVDVSGGVEREPGVKDSAEIRRFIGAVATADAERLRESDSE